MKARHIFGSAIVLVGLLVNASAVFAQTTNVVSDKFTGTSASLNWSAFNGACLTAGNGTGTIPACNGLEYYGTQTQAGLAGNVDTAGNGALRLTNGCVNGASVGPCYYDQNGAIISQTPFSSSAGIQVTFTTYSYSGNKGGSAGNGADGIGFYLIDPSKLPSSTTGTTGATTYSPQIGAWGGSLGYSCSNVNANYNGMLGAYLGLGMDEYGNFLNGAYESGYTGDNTATGQTATSTNGGNGQEYQPQRIGLRGYGNVNLATLQTYYSGATASNVQATCQNGGNYTYPNGSYTITYAWTYSYPPAGNYTTQVGTAVTLSAPNGSSTSYKNACSGTTNTTTGGAGTTAGTAAKYGTSSSQPLYLMSSSISTSSPVLTTKNVKSGNVTYACNVSTTTTTTTYSFTQAGSTNYGTTSSSSSGYTSTGTPFGLVSGNYYPISPSSKSTSTENTSTVAIPDYPAIPNAYVNLPTTTPIANETATSRNTATPISYKLQITQQGLLSLWYSYNGGSYTPVLTNQSIAGSNGPIPSSFLFGFGGSTGGSDNVHEITCFLATPSSSSASSAGINIPQLGNVETGTYLYLAYYHTNNWWGQLTAQEIVVTGGVPAISSVPKWDASCVLTGGACASTGGTNQVQAEGSRTLVTWSGGPGNANSNPAGIPFQWGRLTTTEQGWLSDDGVSLNGNARVDYLSGDRSEEFTSSGSGLFRDRTSVLADIIHSSPTWVGGPNSPYPDTWKDLINTSATMNENATSAQTYSQYVSAESTRINVVYAGANDGFLHGFEAGNTDTDGSFDETYDTGTELIAYMPEAILRTIHNNTTSALDYSSVNYSHNYFVDATPGTGDLFYGGQWHTWLASGLGEGGNGIFVMDVTNPTTLGVGSIIGEWSTATTTTTTKPITTTTQTTLACASDTSTSFCGYDLGQTYGTPVIRRLHNGEWGIIFGNGLNSVTGHAAIYIMTITSAGALDKVYFLDTGAGTPQNPDGIAYVTAADLDGDHISDYVYAGDVYGNVWRFDITNSNPLNWFVSTYGNTTPTPLFTTPSTPWEIKNSGGTVTSSGTTNQPITTAVSVLSIAPASNGLPYLLIEFGTGMDIAQTVTAPESYAPGQQAVYGIWDWNLGVAGTPGLDYASLSGTAAPKTAIALSQLQPQTVTSTVAATGIATGFRAISNNTVCLVLTTCGITPGTDYGWYMNLPGFAGVTAVGNNNQTEQVIYNPVEEDGAFIVDTTIPANNSPLTCSVSNTDGWTMAYDPSTGGAFTTTSFFGTSGGLTNISGAALGLTGSASLIAVGTNTYLAGNQGASGGGPILYQVYPPPAGNGQRLTWLQLH